MTNPLLIKTTRPVRLASYDFDYTQSSESYYIISPRGSQNDFFYITIAWFLDTDVFQAILRDYLKYGYKPKTHMKQFYIGPYEFNSDEYSIFIKPEVYENKYVILATIMSKNK